jgi:hypothetical protein
MVGWHWWGSGDGTAQHDRFPPAFGDGYFRPDEMSFADLLSLSAEYASKLHFYNADKARGLGRGDMLDKARDGNWSDLFSADEAVVMAQILSTDVNRLESACLEQFDRHPREAADFIYQLAKRMDAWLQVLTAVDQPWATALGQTLSDVISRSPAVELEKLRGAMESGGHSTAHWHTNAFHRAWRSGIQGPAASPDAGTPAFEAWQKERVRAAIDSFLHSIAYLQSLTPRYLRESLASQRHNPAMALFIAFLRLFERAQSSANTLIDRHLEFYYRDVLKAVPAPPVADNAWLVLRADVPGKDVIVRTGTAFAAGKDSAGNDVTFLAAHDVLVTDAQVRALCSLRLERDRLISPERELWYVNRARSHRFEGVGGRSHVWPIFGAEEKETCHKAATDAEMGFAVASPVLLLKEGIRTIAIDVQLSDPGDIDPAAAMVIGGVGVDAPDRKIVDALTSLFAGYLHGQRELLPLAARHTVDDHAARMAVAAMATPDDAKRTRRRLQEGRPDRVYDLFLFELVRVAESPEALFRVVGKLFRRVLLGRHIDGETRFDEHEKKIFLEKARAVLTGTREESSLSELVQLLGDNPRTLFYRFLRRAFTISLSTAGGWHLARSHRIAPGSAPDQHGVLGLKFVVQLDADVEPIVGCSPRIHGENWATGLPLVRFQLNALSDFYHYSIFEGLRLRRIAIDVQVEGLKRVLAYNNEGQLDPSKPFLPFGALPAKGAYLIVGNHEMARKTLTDLRFTVEWAGLPVNVGGFRSYYEGYETPYWNDVFQSEVAVLRDGEWHPIDPARRARLPLFESGRGDIVRETRVLVVDAAGSLRPLPAAVPEEMFAFDLRARSGFVKFTLVAPEGAFGHADHRVLMTRVLAENSRLKRPRPLPNDPYTPAIAQLTVAYSARDVIDATSDSSVTGDRGEQHVFQIHPFGVRRIYPSQVGTLPPLLPTYLSEGNLFIGIEASRLSGVLSLFFHMADDSTRELSTEESQIAWFYLSANQWRRLEPSRVLADTTHGFLRSGVVTLRVPPDASADNTLMPAGLFWLSVAVSGDVKSFSSLYSVYTHGLMAARRIDAPYAGERVPEGTIRQTVLSLIGLTGVLQIEPSFGGRGAEDGTALRTRLSERLRHKNRASTPWDYERLVLANFPSVFTVKCFPCASVHSPTPVPGHVLVIVVPAAVGDALSPRLDAVELGRIKAFLQERAAEFVHIDVRNPIYERIQVRCAVKFRDLAYPGLQIALLNQAIVNFLSPWQSGGHKARFGWSVRREDVESFIRGLEYVEFVTDFSLLHITDDEGVDFRLGDTARFWPLTTATFIDFPRFATALRNAADPVSAYLKSQLAPATRALLDAHADERPVPSDLQKDLLAEVNEILKSALLYDEQRFAHVRLSEDTTGRLDRILHTAAGVAPSVRGAIQAYELVAVNRLLLEDAYPGLILPSPARGEEIRPRSPWSIAIPAARHAIEAIDALMLTPPEPSGVSELELVTNFIIS